MVALDVQFIDFHLCARYGKRRCVAFHAARLPPQTRTRSPSDFSLLAFSIYALFFQSSGVLKESLGRDATMSGRTEGWPVMLSVPNNRLVGAGYESFWLGPRLLTLWEAFGGEAHNGYIEMLLVLGWLGVALLGVLIATGYRNVIRAYRRSPEIGSLRIAFFLATIITGFTEAAFEDDVPHNDRLPAGDRRRPVDAAAKGVSSRHRRPASTGVWSGARCRPRAGACGLEGCPAGSKRSE